MRVLLIVFGVVLCPLPFVVLGLLAREGRPEEFRPKHFVPRLVRYAPAVERLEPPFEATQIFVFKERRRLEVRSRDGRIRAYRVALGPNPVGHKEREGDGRTPEGSYVIDWKNPASAYYLSMRISYPNQDDINHAARLGVSPGGWIMIHGWHSYGWDSGPYFDWTAGCIAVKNGDMDEIWRTVSVGTPITIYP